MIGNETVITRRKNVHTRQCIIEDLKDKLDNAPNDSQCSYKSLQQKFYKNVLKIKNKNGKYQTTTTILIGTTDGNIFKYSQIFIFNYK